MSDAVHPPVERTLGRWDLVLLKIVAIVNLNNVPATAVYGWFSVALWNASTPSSRSSTPRIAPPVGKWCG